MSIVGNARVRRKNTHLGWIERGISTSWPITPRMRGNQFVKVDLSTYKEKAHLDAREVLYKFSISCTYLFAIQMAKASPSSHAEEAEHPLLDLLSRGHPCAKRHAFHRRSGKYSPNRFRYV